MLRKWCATSKRRSFKLWSKIFKKMDYKWLLRVLKMSKTGYHEAPRNYNNDFNTYLSGKFSIHNRERVPYHQAYLFHYSFVNWLINSNFQEVIRGLRNNESCQEKFAKFTTVYVTRAWSRWREHPRVTYFPRLFRSDRVPGSSATRGLLKRVSGTLVKKERNDGGGSKLYLGEVQKCRAASCAPGKLMALCAPAPMELHVNVWKKKKSS